jgi:2-dehydro-3-deoxyphosphogluconate aldolase/(4S)-4-hydroxy-2-oxoglutarate aldolase
MKNKIEILTALRETGVVAVIRTDNPGDLVGAAKALREGGVKFIEITMTIPNALKIIEGATSQLQMEDIYIGAGTVLDSETARAVILAGSSFVVGPTYEPEVVQLCNRYSIPVMPGAYTPGEIMAAWKGGADVVKIFPADIGGPGFLKAVKEPLPQIELLPTKGINFETVAAFIKAGAIAVGTGTALVSNELINSKNYKQITDNAKRFIQIIKDARAGK